MTSLVKKVRPHGMRAAVLRGDRNGWPNLQHEELNWFCLWLKGQAVKVQCSRSSPQLAFFSGETGFQAPTRGC
jgi:hypothetical protein